MIHLKLARLRHFEKWFLSTDRKTIENLGKWWEHIPPWKLASWDGASILFWSGVDVEYLLWGFHQCHKFGARLDSFMANSVFHVAKAKSQSKHHHFRAPECVFGQQSVMPQGQRSCLPRSLWLSRTINIILYIYIRCGMGKILRHMKKKKENSKLCQIERIRDGIFGTKRHGQSAPSKQISQALVFDVGDFVLPLDLRVALSNLKRWKG